MPPVGFSWLQHNLFRVVDGEAFQSCNLTQNLVRGHELVDQSLAFQPERNRDLNRVERTKPQIERFASALESKKYAAKFSGPLARR